jgi:hypothetical protein
MLMKTFCAQQYDSDAEDVMSGATRNSNTGSKNWPEAIETHERRTSLDETIVSGFHTLGTLSAFI